MSKLIIILAKVLVVFNFAFVSFVIGSDELKTETNSDFVSVRRTTGQRVITVQLAGMTAVETAAGEPPRNHAGFGRDNLSSGRAEDEAESSFIFREVTNGKELVQVIFDGSYTPKNCFILSPVDREKILDLLNIAQQQQQQQQKALMPNLASQDQQIPKYWQESSNKPTINNNIVTTMAALEPYLQFSNNASDHTFLQMHTRDQSLTPFLRSIIDLNGIKAQCRRLKPTPTSSRMLSKRRQRRSLLTYPQTLWCGQGTEATHYDQLGEAETTDKCCRDHDLCPHLQINPMEKTLFLRNTAPYTMSDCRCDKMFHKCLKRARSPVADGVGDVFFNRLKIKCFVTRKKYQCLKTSWLGTCLRKEKTDTAVVRDARPFPEGKNLTQAEKAIRRKERTTDNLN